MEASILIATYGDPEWETLARTRALPSAQTQGAFEVLVRHEPEGTVVTSRNALGNTAQGDWLCFLDADDELAPGYLGAMRRAFEQQQEQEGARRRLLLTPAVTQVKRGRPSPRPVFFDRGKDLSVDNWLVVGTMLERDLFLQVGGFGEYPHGFEDWSLWAKCWREGAEIVKVPDAVYVYHHNPLSKHKQSWRDRRWQVDMHQRIRAELFPDL